MGPDQQYHGVPAGYCYCSARHGHDCNVAHLRTQTKRSQEKEEMKEMEEQMKAAQDQMRQAEIARKEAEAGAAKSEYGLHMSGIIFSFFIIIN
jgi:hypothetical protein